MMPFGVRPMTTADVPQSMEIERDAFPTVIPPTSFRREIGNRRIGYLVAYSRRDPSDGSEPGPTVQASEGPSLVSALVRGVRGAWDSRAVAGNGRDILAGYLGAWRMADEEHVMSIGVRSDHRGNGIGELLLIGALERAVAHRARLVTLEVRESNHVARNLYLKYGFQDRGVRKGYYADNREDAIIMTTDPIITPSYGRLFQRLVLEHQRRWGPSERVVL